MSFGPETLAFLSDLRDHDDRDWFAANRERYAEHWLGAAQAFVAAAAPAVARLDPRLVGEPRVGGSVFRIHRDIRFSADKRPYKRHLDLWFWEGERATAVSGLYLRITADYVGVGVGAHRFDRDRLARYRSLVPGPAGDRLLAVLDRVLSKDVDLHGETLTRGPRGVTTDDPARARLLRHTALWSTVDAPPPGILGTARFVDWCVRRWERQLPLHRWLVDELG